MLATTFALPGGTFHALALGDPAAPPLLWLHGFPDHPPTARAFLTPFAATHRVIAPWLRGYAPSPVGGPYDVDTLARDVGALIDELGGRVDLVGHDWGAVITYAVCAQTPHRVRRAVTLAVPHPATFVRALVTSSQLLRSWYMVAFQLPLERVVGARGLAALVDRLWRSWSPGLVVDDEAREALHACLAASMPAPLGYYRANRRLALAAWLREPITTPLYQLHGAADGCVLPPRADDRRRFTADHACEVVPKLGHFLHLEEPASIAARIARWLA
ncbi:MAG: alpha/beta hydrolase [Myxococcota bacterium]|nr:alpha/beta hydrolase [Myxococcota bacterium]